MMPMWVDLVGQPALLDKKPFNDKSRIPLVQSFKHKRSNETFTLAVNHFKSKSCRSASGANKDQKDGQGCYNPVRVTSATMLADWLATNPTGVNDKDVLIIGDLNAYAKEEPITTLERAGYANLLARDQGEHAYSYVYRGLAGYLDHAMATQSMAAKVAEAFDWHINADEMTLIDYRMGGKSLQQAQDLYRPNAYRSSDHDPMIVDLKL